MKMVALTDAASLLGITQKWLSTWAKDADIPLHAHPTDARSRCLTLNDVQRLATLHNRNFRSDLLGTLPIVDVNGDEKTFLIEDTTQSLPLSQETDLRQRVSHLEAIVEKQQRQIAILVLNLKSLTTETNWLEDEAFQKIQLQPAEQRARDRKLSPYVYFKDGKYIISSAEGLIPIVVDTPEWFTWLGSLTSFRFVGERGHYTALRVIRYGKSTRSWIAQRTVDKQLFKKYLGLTPLLTIDYLESGAAFLETRIEEFKNKKNP